MIFSGHAREEMQNARISEEEVKGCIEHGELEIKEVVQGETRWGKKLDLKDKTIMVIYTLRENEERIITTYVIRRKKWQK